MFWCIVYAYCVYVLVYCVRVLCVCFGSQNSEFWGKYTPSGGLHFHTKIFSLKYFQMKIITTACIYARHCNRLQQTVCNRLQQTNYQCMNICIGCYTLAVLPLIVHVSKEGILWH